MHAIVCHEHGGPEVMRYEEVVRPEPAAGEVLVQAEAIGVNYVDTMRRSGRHPAAPAPPFTPGIELAGRIAAVGPGVEGWQVGDRVVARCVSHGSYAEYVRAEARFVAARPESVAAEDGAALLVNGLTAYHALTTVGQLRPGDNVLITAAAGGVGTCAMQIARILGARVIAAAGSPWKLALARDFGADVLVDYSQPGWPQQVLAVTSGQGASLILESAKTGGSVAEILKAAAADAREIKSLEEERRVSMMTYLIVLYVVFFVFVTVLAANEASAANAKATGQSFGTTDVDRDAIGFAYYLAGVVQAAGNGLIAGILTEGRITAGLRHVAILVGSLWVVFRIALGA